MPPPAATAEGISRYTPRVLVFGLPRSGKTDLIRTINKLAAADSGVDVVNLTPVGTNPAIRGEVLRWVVPSPDGRPGSESVILYDCDGQAARELVKHPDLVTRRTGRSALAETVRASHALVCLVNASADEAEVRATFREMNRFVGGLEEGRLIHREVGGLPVFLVLTRCDELWRPGQDRGDWEHAVEQRTDALRKEFKEYFGTDFSGGEGDEEGEVLVEGAVPPGFGTLDLRVRAVAREFPAFTDTTRQTEPWQVRELFQEVAGAGGEYCRRAIASRKRLRATLAGAGLLVGMLWVGFLTLIVSEGFGGGDFLAERVRAVQATEGPPAVRLADRNHARNVRELTAIRAAEGFSRLPHELQEYVADRLREYEAYRGYRNQFRPPRLGPAEARTREQLDALAADLKGTLAPPAEYAAAWAETDAGQLWRKWQADLALFADAETQLHDWYRTLIRLGNDLLLTTAPPDYGWRLQVTDLLRRGEAPPYPPGQAIEKSPALPILRGRKLTYGDVYDFERVATARADWVDTRDRLVHLRDLTDALGMTVGPGTPPAVLDLPEPGLSADDSRLLAMTRLAALRATFPTPAYPDADYPEWAAGRFPDPVRTALAARLGQALAAGTRHVRRLIGAALGDAAGAGPETQFHWRGVADTLLQDEPLKAWGRLLSLLRRWQDPSAPPADPVAELAEFVRRDRFDVNIQSATVVIPDALLVPRLVPGGRLVVTHTPTGGSPAEYAYRQEGEAHRDPREAAYAFVPDGHAGTFTLRPGDGLSAVLPARSGAQEYRLVWSAGSSAVYQMDRLTRTPRLEKVGPIPIPEPAAGVQLTTAPPGGLPPLPALVPDLRAGPR